MDSTNVYSTPRAAVRDVTGVISHTVTENILAALRKTRPWVLLIAILGFIGAFFTAIAGIMMIAALGYMGSMGGDEGNMVAQMMGGTKMFIGLGILYLAIAVIYIIISIYLLRYAGAIKRLSNSLNVADLEDALNAQASFWKTVGIMALISIVAMIVFWIVGIGAAVSQIPANLN
jgi:hypothetical protein